MVARKERRLRNDDIEAELDRIFAEPPEAFTKARNELAARVKRSGEGERAAAIKALRRPTRPAWVVNRLALEQPAEFGDLRQAAARLRKLGAGSGKRLREAAAAERAAVSALMELAGEMVGDERGSAVLDRVAETLQAVAADEAIEKVAARGRLEREQRVATFGGFAIGGSDDAPAADDESDGGGEDVDPKRVTQARKRVRELRRRVESAARRESKAHERVDRAAAALAEARERLDEEAADHVRVSDELAAAEAELADLER